MASNISGGSVVWDFDVDQSKFQAGIAKATTEAKAFGNTVNAIDFKKLTTNATQAFDGVANSIASLAKKVAIGAVAAGALGGVFLKSAGDLEITSKSMQVLVGNTEAANKLFGQLAIYANQTPFEFKQIADAGRTLLGFGIPLQDVLPNIKMLGDLAGVTGADFKSLAVVFGQVNATGRLMGQDALQLINNNIPITTILAKKLGVSVQDVKQRMEDGAISAGLFNEALKETTSQGGFAFQGADKLAQTFQGRLSTLKDAVMEFGRNLLGVKVDPELGLVVAPGGIFDKLSQLLPKIGDALKKMEPQVKAAFEFVIANGGTILQVLAGFAAAFVAMKVAILAIKIGKFIGGFVQFVSAIRAGTGVMAAFNAVTLVNPFVLIALAIAAVIGVLVFLQLKFKIFNKAWDAMKTAWEATVSFFKDHAELFKKIMIGLAAIILLPILPIIALGVLIAKNFTAIKDTVVGVFTAIYNVIVTVLTAIWNFISPILKFILNLYIIVFGGILLIILTVLTAIKDLFIAIFTAIWNFLQPIIQGIWNFIVTVFTAAWNSIVTIFTAVFNFIVGIWNSIYATITGIVKSIIDFFAPAFNWLLQKGKDIVNGLVAGIKAVAGAVWDAIKAVADPIGKFFAGAANWLFDTGKAIVQGMINGIKSMIKSVGEAAGNIGDAVKSKVKGLLGIGSPSKVFHEYGVNLLQGMAAGISASKGLVTDSLANFADAELNPVVKPDISGFAMSGGASTRIENNIGTINIANDVDAENWLQKLTRQDEVTKAGLTA
jgi:tape measure domain-containing protein